MENHLVSDNDYNMVCIYSAEILLQGMTNIVRSTFCVGDTTRAVQN
jgi:hypothetical protein